MKRQRAFTLLELMIVVVLVAIVLTLAAPSFYDFIKVQRLKGVNAQLVTDLQYARGEAVSRGIYMRVVFGADSAMTCYTLYTLKLGSNPGVRCNCLLGPGAACTDSHATELRTVQVPRSSSVTVLTAAGVDPAIAFDNVTGGLLTIPQDTFSTPSPDFVIDTSIDPARILRTTLASTGRPTVCGTAANLGAPLC
jgi:type IV fimbrial biogenesis protein FimT